MFEALPDELKELSCWGCFRLQPRGEKMTKIPVNPHNGGPGKSNDESTWSDFDTAVQAMQDLGCHGLGFYFKPPYFGVDLDDVREEIERYRERNEIDGNMVAEFIETLGSYTEYSVSGNGIHIIAKGELPAGGRRKGNVEMYDSGRFFAMTGKPAAPYTHIHDDTDLGVIQYLHNKYINTPATEQAPVQRDGDQGHDIAEERLIEIAENSRTGTRFKMFINGGWEQFYESQSEADMAFANDLAFWTNRDFQKMDSIFRRSSLMREKFDRAQNKSTYGAETLQKAIDQCSNTFAPREIDDDYNLFVEEHDVQQIQNTFYSYDDTGNAQRFKDAYGPSIRYSYTRSSWYFYDGKVWTIDQEGRIKNLADQVIMNMRNERPYVTDDMDEEEALKALRKHIKASRSSRGKSSMIKESEHLLPVKQDQFDKDIDLFNVQNGYLNLETGRLHDHDRNRFFTKISNVEYTDKSDCPLWMEFLHTIFDGNQDLISYIQRAVGYSLSGSTEEQKLFFLHGNGSNGKSVFLDVITDLFGNYSTNIQPQTIMMKQQGGGPSPDIAKLDGARLVTTTEPDEGVRLAEGLVKQLTGSDKITARFLHQDEFEFKPQFKLWMATNHKPIIRGTDDGIWRRLVIIPFSVQIPDHKKDRRLTQKLRREMSAILNWAVEGYLDWRKFGLKEPDTIQDQRQSYRTEMDVVEGFLEECCTRSDDGRVQAKQLYEIYKDWAQENHQYLMSSTKFGKEVAKRFPKFKSSGIWYRGVSLNREVEKPFHRMTY
ncbi:phage/plasmid primase, P4 family [Alkalicoccus luteus]|uniref:DNA primase n=1 Tax=Alkalicoccus luteus TaxID=1237094 RepID=A0A969PQJ9_9BACI|nr:phage/plasmid primase, P4 family [Alkalicoccus luteus]NJP37169.1 DNA primase [Alkalicoccus luteus]